MLLIQSSVCEKIVELLNEANSKRSSQKIAIIYQEDFYKKFSTEKTQSLEKKHFNFDHPGSVLKVIQHVKFALL